MRARGVAVQAAIATGALLLAAVTWLRPPTPSAPGEVPVASLGPGDVSGVHFDDGSHRVDVVRAVVGQPGVSVRVGRSLSLTAPDGGVGRTDGGLAAGVVARSRPDGGTFPPDAGVRALRDLPPPPDRELRGNEMAEKLLDRVSPLLATRSLGVLTPERRAEMGLAARTKTLQLDARPGNLRFVIATPPGASGTYLLADDGRAWIIADALVQDLESASSRLVDRRLHPFRMEDVDTLSLQLDGRTRTFAVRRVQGVVRLAPAETPDVPNQDVTAWADRLWRLTPTELLARGEAPREGAPGVLLRVEYARNRRPLGFTELARAGGEAFVRTEHTVGWVRVPPQSLGLAEQAERLEPPPPGP